MTRKKMQDCEHCIHTYGTLGCCDMVNNEWIYDCEFGKEQYKKEHEQQPCEDCISREAVIRLVEQYPNIIGNRCSGLIADIKHLPSVTPQQIKWIPVSERLPEENIHVLCQFYIGGMAECYHAHDYWHIVGDFRIKIDDVIAWMPLPQPYAESEEKKCEVTS